MSVTYDWSPLFQAIQGASQRSAYNRALDQVFPQQQPAVQQPTGPLSGDSMGLPPQSGPMPNAQGPAASPGPAASSNPYAAMLPMLKFMDPSMGMPLLMQLQMKQAERQQKLQDERVTPMTDEQAAQWHLRPGGSYGLNAAGSPVTIQPSDMKSQGSIDQQLALQKITPITDPNDPRLPPKNVRPPGASYGVDAAGNIVEDLKGDAKSPLAQSQAMAEREAAIEAQMRMYGLGDGTAADGTKPLQGPYETVAKSIANYGMDENASLSRYPAPVRAAIQARVLGLNPDYRQQDYAASKAAQTNFATGKNGNTVRSLNVAISHLDTLGHLSDALGNGNLQVANSIGQGYAQQTGSAAPTNFDTAKTIVGDEITKAIIGTGGSQADRDKAQSVISRANSPAQLKGAIQTYQKLLGGQLRGLRQQYETTTKAKNFNDYLSPETQTILGGLSDEASASPAPGAKNDPLSIR